MHSIQKDLVHTVEKGRCGNCRKPKEAHVDGACLFDFTQYREETVNDHLDCSCERVIEEDNTVTDGDKVHVDMKIRVKKTIQYMGLTFTV
jgi:hypothetical protein